MFHEKCVDAEYPDASKCHICKLEEEEQKNETWNTEPEEEEKKLINR